MGFFSFKKRSKYGNKTVRYNGMSFDSKKELERYHYLTRLEISGVIEHLRRQVRFEIVPAIREEYEVQLKTKTTTKTRTVQKAITYTADFEYYDVDTDSWIVEDVKSSPNQAALDKCYVLKKKLMYALKGIKIKEVYSPNANTRNE